MARFRLRGISLAEIIVAIGVLGIFSTAIFSAVANSYRLSQRSVDTSRALYLSNTVMEDVQTRMLGEGWVEFDNTLNGVLLPDPLEPDFCYRMTVTDVGSNSRKIECRVFWQDQDVAPPTIDTEKGTNGLIIRSTTLVYSEEQ
jgi:type II secretory pathway pseudopilin PulG